MPLAENNFLQVPLGSLCKFYNNEVVPHLTKRNKIIGIGAAALLSFYLIMRDLMLKPPLNIRHIPYFGYSSILKTLLRGESLFDRGSNVTVPYVDKSIGNKLYSEPGKTGKWEINVSNPEEAYRVLRKNNLFLKTAFDELSSHTLINKFLGDNLVTVPSGDQWKAHRKVINPAFRRASPIQLFGEVTKELFETMDKLGETIDMVEMTMRCTLESMGRTAFGYKFGAISNFENKWTSMYYDVCTGFTDYKFFIFPFLDDQLSWLFPKRREYHRKMENFLDMLDIVIQHKRDALERGEIYNTDLGGDNEKDILTMMLQSEDTLSQEEIRSNLHVLFYLGNHAASSVISFALYYLGKNPEFQEKARKEVLRVLGDEPEDIIPFEEDLKQMTYVNQVLKETLRLGGPVPKITPRLLTEDTTIEGTFIPKGSLITVNIFNIHNSEHFWDNPKDFNPDRFSGEEGKKLPALAFGDGTRVCLGKNYSMNQQRLMLAMLLRKYTWTVPEDTMHDDGVVTTGVPLVTPKGPLPITFKKRY